MKILFLLSDASIFTPDSPKRKEFQTYASRAEELHVLAPARHGTKEIEEGTLFLHPFPGLGRVSLNKMAGYAHKLIVERSIDVISVEDPFEYATAGQKARVGTKAKLHVHVETDLSSLNTHKGFFPDFSKNKRKKEAIRNLSNTDAVSVTSERIKKSIIENTTIQIPISVITPYVVQEVPQRVSLPPRPFTFTFATVSALEEGNGLEDIYKALATLATVYPQVGLVVIGTGTKEHDLKSKASSLGVKERVLFLGERSDAWGLVQDAHAYIQVGTQEKCEDTLLQAALAHVPIITIDAGFVGELFIPGSDVLLVSKNEVADLTFQMRVLVEDQRLRHVLAMGAHTKAQEYLSKQSERINDRMSCILSLVSST